MPPWLIKLSIESDIGMSMAKSGSDGAEKRSENPADLAWMAGAAPGAAGSGPSGDSERFPIR